MKIIRPIDLTGVSNACLAINQSAQRVIEIAQQGKQKCASAKLTVFKLKTVKTGLTVEERVAAIDLVQEMNSNNWLTQADIDWCNKNNISVHS